MLDAFQREIIDLLPRLRRLARSLCGDAADADDLVQTGVERALSRRDQWQPGSRLDWWIMRIMRNAFIDEVRRKGRVALSGGEDLDHVVDSSIASADLKIDAMALSQAMGRLPADQRLAVALVLVEGLSYAEAAEVLEIPAGTLTSRLVRGRQALLAEMGAQGVTA
jgi:RNA polymerase sigma-70 factor (ECF subfamily)